MLDVKEVARMMSKEVGIEVKEEHVAKLPDDGTPGHMDLGHWDVYGARAGEFTVLLYDYDSGKPSVIVV
jgi:hypothetical protein